MRRETFRLEVFLSYRKKPLALSFPFQLPVMSGSPSGGPGSWAGRPKGRNLVLDGEGGDLKALVLNYAKESLAVKSGPVDLGDVPDGPVPRS
ncbi:MAG: hypothetical protein ACYS99_11765 [Planctomycetota bacterium]|jgi:hypothetical protein